MNGYKPVPVAFDEGAAYYYTARGTHPRWSNRVVAWSRQSSSEVFDAVQGNDKEMHVIPEAGHFDLYDLAPCVSEAFEYITPFFEKNLRK